jgi:hypothetical protein
MYGFFYDEKRIYLILEWVECLVPRLSTTLI